MGGLIFVGLGLAGLQDITLRGLDAVRSADVVVAEFYTSHLIGAEISEVEALVGKKIKVLGREDVEIRADKILADARSKLVAFLVAGDAMSATTHHDLRARAADLGIPTRYIPGVSIFTTAPASAGLQIYKFGRTTTIPFSEGRYQPESFYDVVRDNKQRGLHTLVLLDIQADKGRYMTIQQAVESLLQVEAKRDEKVVEPNTIIIGLARVGGADERVVAARADAWKGIDLGPPLHCLIVPGTLHFQEEAALSRLGAGAASRSV